MKRSEEIGPYPQPWVLARYQMALEDAQLKHGDETKPIENPEAHLKAYRESVKIMKSLGWMGPRSTAVKCCSVKGCRLGISTFWGLTLTYTHQLVLSWSLLDHTHIFQIYILQDDHQRLGS